MAAKAKSQATISFVRKPKVKRPGVHAKTKTFERKVIRRFQVLDELLRVSEKTTSVSESKPKVYFSLLNKCSKTVCVSSLDPLLTKIN